MPHRCRLVFHISSVLSMLAASLAAVVLGAGPASARDGNVWLCNPVMLHADPCRGDLATTVQSSPFAGAVVRPTVPASPAVDCFYVYPTVSNQVGPSASKTVEPEERSIARYQVQRFSQQCRVFAPIYRQGTLLSILTNGFTDASRQLAYNDVLAAFRDYLAHDNNGRGIVLIGHSQGTGVLRRLIAQQFDTNAALRNQLVSAILLGGNVTVRVGSDRGGDFENVPLCTRPGQFGCVIAYSTFLDDPPTNSRFGRVAPGVDRLTGLPPQPDTEVACTNPASLSANSDSNFTTYVPTKPFAPGLILVGTIATFVVPPLAPTPWVQPADRYAGRCEHINGAHVLKLHRLAGARHLNAFPDASWGLHLLDINGTLGNLQHAVDTQSAAYLQTHAG